MQYRQNTLTCLNSSWLRQKSVPRESAIFRGFWFLTNQASVSLMSGRLVIVSLSSNNYRLDQVDMTFGLCSRLDVRHMAAESPARFPHFSFSPFPGTFLAHPAVY